MYSRARVRYYTGQTWRLPNRRAIAKIEPLLPRMPRSQRGGRPWASRRAVADDILWVLKTGSQWRNLSAEYPSPSTCWRRLKPWDKDGTWLQIWSTIIAELDARGR